MEHSTETYFVVLYFFFNGILPQPWPLEIGLNKAKCNHIKEFSSNENQKKIFFKRTLTAEIVEEFLSCAHTTKI